MALFGKKRKNELDDRGFELFEMIGDEKRQRIEAHINGCNAQVQQPMNATVPFENYSEGQTTEQIVGNHSATESALVGLSQNIGKRKSQQDAVSMSKSDVYGGFTERWLGVLCDGMGGMNGGEKASAIGVQTTLRLFSDYNAQGEFNIPGFYRALIDKIDYDVSSLEDENGRYLGAGTTFISVIIDKGCLYWASVGDSHIYIIRNNEIKMVVREHNYFMELLDMVNNGEITYEEACNDKSKDALTSYIGMGGVNLMEINDTPLSLMPGDIVLLCSDGLYRSVTDQEILKIVSDNKSDMNFAAQALTQYAMAKNNPHQDNTSVVIAKYN